MKGRRLLDAMAHIDDDLIEDAAYFAENGSGNAVRFFEKRARLRQLAACAAALFVAVASLWVWKGGSKVYEESVPDAVSSENGAYADGGLSDEAAPEAAPAEDAAEGVADDASQEKNADGGGVCDLEASKQDAAAEGIADKENALAEGAADMQQQKGPLRVRIIEEFPQTGIACYAAPDKGEVFQGIGLMAAIDCWDDGNNTMDIADPESYLYRVKIDIFGDVGEDDVSYEQLGISGVEKEKLNKEYERMAAIGLNVSLSEEFELTGLLSRDEIEGFEPNPDYGYMFRLVNEP